MIEITDDVAGEQMDLMGVPPGGAGILLLTASMQLLYKDRRAWELCRQIIRSQDGKRAHGVLPLAVATLVDQIRRLLTVRASPKDLEQIQLRHVVNTLDHTVVLSGTAFFETNAEARILIVIREAGVGAWLDQAIVKAKKEFHLTAREITVVHHLFKGWTNKQIAHEMNLADQTIKEHFRNISEKMRTTTRTEMVMKVIHSGFQHHAQSPYAGNPRDLTPKSGDSYKLPRAS